MVEDVDGNRYLDFMAGIAVSSTGYGHPKVVAAVKDAADRFLHICGSDFYYEGMAELCERLARIAPGPRRKRVFLTNSGTEATEGAIKLARYATRRTAIIAFRGAFHGRTTGAVSLTSQQGPPARRVRPAAARRAPRPVRLPLSLPVVRRQAGVHPRLPRRASRRSCSPGTSTRSDVAAIFVEPMQGEGGYVVPPAGWLRDLRDLCDRHGILLVADEVQSGVGRTGKMWACEHEGVEPDILLTAKGLGSGMPIGRHRRKRVDQHVGERLARLDLRRQSRLLRRRARDARSGRERADGERRVHGRAAHGRGSATLAAKHALHRRRAGRGPHGRRRVREGPRDARARAGDARAAGAGRLPARPAAARGGEEHAPARAAAGGRTRGHRHSRWR